MSNFLVKIYNKINHLTKRQRMVWVASGMVGIAALGLVIAILCYPMKSEPVQEEIVKQPEKTPVEEVAQIVEEVVETKKISFTGTSIEKDLKVKINDETDTLVTGVVFRITVTEQKNQNAKEYSDDDKDGIIHIQNMEAGEYQVQLHEAEGFVIAEPVIRVSVKNKVVYKKVDVKNEIKKESEVDMTKEEVIVQRPQDDYVLQNTVELVESTSTIQKNTEEQIELNSLTKAFADEEKKDTLICGEVMVSTPKNITLYSQGGELSRKYQLQADIVGPNELIKDYTWKPAVEGFFTAEKQADSSVVLTSVAIGNCDLILTVMYEDGLTKSLQSQSIQINVVVSEFTDDKAPLKNELGELLYLDQDLKNPATVKDYGKVEVYYAPKYTGWQTIDGKTYYFDTKHNAVKGVQVIGGVRYNFGDDGALLKSEEQRGIDVSKWQGKIDWQAVAGAGIDFAVIRVGHRGSQLGTLIEDPYFKANIEGATKAGVKVGVYFYSQAITLAEAIEEASMALTLVAGYRLHLPIYIDTEAYAGGRANNMDAATRTAVVKAFCETIKNSGYMAGVYSNKNWFENNLIASQLRQYSIWVAQYNSTCTYKERYDMWQYTSSGSVPGITGRVDMNTSYVKY